MESANVRSETSGGDVWRSPLNFEGHAVSGVKNVVRGSLELDSDECLGVDDRLVAKVEMRVVGVRHEVDAKGDLIRTQILKPILSYVARWDDTNPDDTGIERYDPEAR